MRIPLIENLSHDSERAVFNISWLLVEKVFRLVFSFSVGVLVARFLGPDLFGQLCYAISFAGLFEAFVTVGLENVLVREIVRNPEKSDILLVNAWFLRLLGSFVMWCSLALILNQMDVERQDQILIFIIASSSLFRTLAVVELFFQANLQSRYFVFVQLGQIVFSAIFRLLLITFNAPILGFAVACAIDNVILGGGSLVVFRLVSKRLPKIGIDRELCLQLFRKSWPFLLSSLVIGIYLKVDQVMLKMMSGDRALGYYGVAVRVSTIWYFVPAVVSASLFPSMVKWHEKNPERYFRNLQLQFDFLIWIALLGSVIGTILSPPVFVFLFGSEFAPSVLIFNIHIWSGVFIFSSRVSGNHLIAEGMAVVAFVRNAAGLVVNIILNILLIPKFGPVGAALATLGSVFVAYFLFLFLQPQTREMGILHFKSFFSGPIRIFRYLFSLNKKTLKS